jgi:predicted ATPase
MKLTRFTIFRDDELHFSSGLNVIVGENSVGKSHLLKLAYSSIATSAEAGRKSSVIDPSNPTKVYLQKAYGEKLNGVFRPEYLGRLASRRQDRNRTKVRLQFADEALDTEFSFAASAKTDVQVEWLPKRWDKQIPVYFPTRELLTIYPGFISMYESHYLEFEETWRDTCILLGALVLRGEREASAAKLLAPIEQAMGGKVVLDNNGRFYLNIPGSGNLEMPLVAEGLRKLAMLARLIANGVIQEQGYLFWDEPESNLNPRLIRLVAQVIHALCERGVQVFIATHSLFMLRELEILQANHDKKQPGARFFGLTRINDSVHVLQGNHIDDIGGIVALDESLQQSDRYLAMED